MLSPIDFSNLNIKDIKNFYPNLPDYYFFKSPQERVKYFKNLNSKYYKNLKKENKISLPKHKRKVSFNFKMNKTLSKITQFY